MELQNITVPNPFVGCPGIRCGDSEKPGTESYISKALKKYQCFDGQDLGSSAKLRGSLLFRFLTLEEGIDRFSRK